MSSSPLSFQDFPDYEILQNLLNSLPVGIFMVRVPDAQPVFMNSKAVEILEQQLHAEANINNLSQAYRAYKYGTDEFYKPSEMPITAGLEGRSLVIDDMEIRLPDGRRKLLFATGSPVYDTKGNMIYSLAAFYDITEQSRIKNELEKSELKFRKLVANSSDVLAIINHEGKEVFVSDSSKNITGYTPEELIQVGGHHFIAPADLPRIQASYARLIADKDYIFHEEYMFRHKNGQWLTIEAYARNLSDDPQIQGIVVNFRDITERKEIANALQKSEELYRTLSEHVPVGLYRFQKSAQGLYSFPYLSSKVFEITATNPDSLIEDIDSLIALVHPDHQEDILTELKRSEDTLSAFRIEFLFRRNGVYAWLSAQAIPALETDGSITWNGVVIDINETKTTELALINERERLKNVIEGTNAGTWEFNSQTKEIILNEKFSQITGFDPEEISSITFRQIVSDLVHIDDVKTLFRIFREHSNGESDFFEAEIRILNQIKEWLWVSLKGKIITRSRCKRPEWVFGTIVNIHQRKLLDIEQREANEMLKSLKENIVNYSSQTKMA
jgi:PAS domain S-box-containing protein